MEIFLGLFHIFTIMLEKTATNNRWELEHSTPAVPSPAAVLRTRKFLQFPGFPAGVTPGSGRALPAKRGSRRCFWLYGKAAVLNFYNLYKSKKVFGVFPPFFSFP